MCIQHTFYSVYINVDYTFANNHHESQILISVTFALEEASSNGATWWTNDNQEGPPQRSPLVEKNCRWNCRMTS